MYRTLYDLECSFSDVVDSKNRVIREKGSGKKWTINVTAGETYTFSVFGRGGNIGAIELRDITRDLAQERQYQEKERAEQARLAALFRQAGNNLGGMQNTSWVEISNTTNVRFDFGDGNYKRQGNVASIIDLNGTGTFRVSGNTVIMRNDSDGTYFTMQRIGNSLDDLVRIN